jgi:rhodanese-related sulfurtransferase
MMVKRFMSFQFIKPENLAKKIQKKYRSLTSEPILIIDVREPHQFQKSHISGARNIESKEFLALKSFDPLQYKEIVLHCQLSLIRGPASANHLDSLLRRQGRKDVQVLLLDGGFKGWSNLFADQPDLSNTKN